jgi:glycosyltransferase involved in cell wall biosynthesis
MTTTTSVALATYNGEKYLPEQLASIAAQSRRPDEIVVGDDQSTDGTQALLEKFSRDSGIALRFTRNPQRLGSSANFAAVLARCQGDVVFLCDQDDVWAPNRIAASLAQLEARPELGFVFANANLITGDGAPMAGSLWGRVFFDERQKQKFREGRGADVLFKTNVVTGATMAIRRTALAAALPVPPGWVHDGWLAFIIDRLHGGLPIDQPLISYRVHATQQIGVIGWSPGQMLGLIRKQSPAFYRSEAKNFRALSDRLLALGPEHAEVAARATKKAEFLELRATGRESLGACVSGIASALAKSSYARYGMGVKQVAFDLIGAIDAASRRFTSGQRE